MVKKNSYRDLKSKYDDYIIIQKAGCFYDIRGEGAKLLSKKFGYKLFLDKSSENKIGVPVSQIQKILDYIKQNNYKYVLTEHYEIIEKNDNGISIIDKAIDKKCLPEENSSNEKIERKVKYQESIDKIRNFILNKNSWVDVREIETFLGLKRRGKIDKTDNLSTVAHLIRSHLKKEGFKTKRIDFETDYTIFVAPDDIDKENEILENNNPKEDLKDFNKIIKLINQGKNIFVTGNAGTGKSFLLNKLKEKFKKKLELTSTTGLAAVNIKGSTIHSWCGVGICKKPIQNCVDDILKRRTLVNKIRKCNLLAIDEISMLNGYSFNYIDQVLRMVRKENIPFGGIQVLLFGDFFQLPPVELNNNEKDFCFETQTWKDLNLKTVKLEKIYRQTDKSFIKVLNDIREGKISKKDIDLLKSREIDYDETDSSILHIFSRNDEANNYNMKKFNSINSEIHTFKATLGVYRGSDFITTNLTKQEEMSLNIFQKNCKVNDIVSFKQGCRVMLLINLDFEKGLMNGSCGEIMSFNENSISVKFDNGIEKNIEKYEFEYYYNDTKIASMTQFPLKLAYAITIHKSQGMTLENVAVDCNKIFEEGQTYVALSRVKSLNGLYLKGFSEDKIKVNKKVIEFYRDLI